jgi:GNAT superfamily N-acetyltransferase
VDLRVGRYEPSQQDEVVTFIRAEDIDSTIADEIVDGEQRFPLWVAWRQARVVGVLEGDLNHWYSDDGPFPVSGVAAWVNNMAVAAAVRRHRVGASLIQTFAAGCEEAGKAYIGLMVHPIGDVAGRVAFFERCGFSRVPEPDRTVMGAFTAALRAYRPTDLS